MAENATPTNTLIAFPGSKLKGKASLKCADFISYDYLHRKPVDFSKYDTILLGPYTHKSCTEDLRLAFLNDLGSLLRNGRQFILFMPGTAYKAKDNLTARTNFLLSSILENPFSGSAFIIPRKIYDPGQYELTGEIGKAFEEYLVLNLNDNKIMTLGLPTGGQAEEINFIPIAKYPDTGHCPAGIFMYSGGGSITVLPYNATGLDTEMINKAITSHNKVDWAELANSHINQTEKPQDAIPTHNEVVVYLDNQNNVTMISVNGEKFGPRGRPSAVSDFFLQMKHNPEIRKKDLATEWKRISEGLKNWVGIRNAKLIIDETRAGFVKLKNNVKFE